MTTDGVLVGEIAHIEAAKPEGPRFRESMTDEDRRASANLLLLCGTHHTIIDGDPATWTVKKLQGLKASHEAVYTGAVYPEQDATVIHTDHAQGVQQGTGNQQHNYFAPVTNYLLPERSERPGDVGLG